MNQRESHDCPPSGNFDEFEDLDEDALKKILGGCPSCHERVAAFSNQRSLLRSWGEEIRSPDLWEEVRGKLVDRSEEDLP